MSWLNSVSSFVSGAGASARKLVTSISQESDGKEVVTPNIEVSEESEGQLLNNSINYECDIGYWNIIRVHVRASFLYMLAHYCVHVGAFFLQVLAHYLCTCWHIIGICVILNRSNIKNINDINVYNLLDKNDFY